MVGRDGRSHVVILGMQVENMGCFSSSTMLWMFESFVELFPDMSREIGTSVWGFRRGV